MANLSFTMKTVLLLPIFFILFGLLAPCLLASSANKNPLVIILLGAPGAGKGTQAVRLSQQLQLPHISTGDLFRENLKNQTELGKKVKSYMEQGQLVPDQLVLDMLFDRVSRQDAQNGYILDGFPRTIPQANAFNELVKNKALVLAISLEVPDELIVDRISGRFVCETCGTPFHATTCPPKQTDLCDRCQGKLIQRKDDTKDVVTERLHIYHQQTEPLKQYYNDNNCLVLIDGTKPVDAISEHIQLAIKNFLENPNSCMQKR